MNNYQISRNRSLKTSKSPKTVPEKETRRTLDSEKEKNDYRRPDESNPHHPLNIYLESDRQNTVISRFEWTAKDFQKKFQKEVTGKNLGRSSEESEKQRKKREVKSGKKWDKSFGNSEWFVRKHSKLTLKDKPYIKRVQKKRDSSNLHEITFKGNSKGLGDSGKPSLNSLFRLRKEEALKKRGIVFTKQENSNKTSIIFDLGVVPAPETQHLKRVSKTEVRLSISEIKKFQINEILKGHAQKTQTIPPKPEEVKEYSFQGVSELLERVQTIHKSKEKKEKKQIKEVKVETPKEPEPLPKKKNIVETKEIEFKKEQAEDNKKIANKWIKFPQVNEIERKEKISGQETTALCLHTEKNISVGENNNEEENDDEGCDENDDCDEGKTKESDKISEKSREKEKISKKRKTYTDRLLFSKMLEKKKEDKKLKVKKHEEGKQEETKPEEATQDEKKPKEIRSVKKVDTFEKSDKIAENQVVTKKLECFESKPAEMSKEISLVDNSALLMAKDAKISDHELYLKAKSSKSAELRDLVAQAVKEHKIFCIFDSHGYIVRPVREELLSRGWLEVIPDRRLIPRRRPPPMGPTYDRDKAVTERNSNLLEAVLTAKEAFADEIQESVSRSVSLRASFEKPKLSLSPQTPSPTKKSSSESLIEVFSQFRIMPPTSEKKKNNSEIREFVNKCQAIVEKEKEKDRERIKEKKGIQKNNKTVRKDKNSSFESNPQKQAEGKNQTPESREVKNEDSPRIPQKKSLLAIVEGVTENRAAIPDLGSKDSSTKDAFEVLYKGTPLEAEESKEKSKTQTNPPLTDSHTPSVYTDSEAKIISKIIQSTNARIHFMWLSIKPAIHLKCFNYSPEIVNKFQKTTFCTKIGLWSHLNNIQWYAHEVHFPAKSPRMYNTGEADDLQAFFQDFQLTACIGMLKWLSDTFFDRGMKAVQAKKGKVPLKAFEFAIRQCEKYIRFKDNEDLGVLEEPKALQEDWNTFLQWFYIITNDHGKVQESSSAQLMVVYTKAVETLRLMKRHWPEIDTDGRLNIWIMKPYCASCGRGIFLTNNVYYISQHSKYIVQKYIEKPLLIYNTKFDIRQWFMITKLTPLEIWMYKECYLRFCTQPFALRNLHESVHLSNNSVQRKYTGPRDPGIPDQNMWDSHTFQLYLKTIGHPNTWQDIIYPGMRDAIVSTMLAAQETFDGPRRNWFEVYGADFMLSSNPKDGPWLIEINENPAMDPSTKVTARLCPQMLRDVIKVVVDKRNNKNANTGQWELVYRQNYTPSFGTVDLDVRGKKILKVPHPVSINPTRNSSYNIKRNTEETEVKPVYDIVKSFDSTQNKVNSDAVSADTASELKDKNLKGSKVKPKVATGPKPVDTSIVKGSKDKIQKPSPNSEKVQKPTNQKHETNPSVKSVETPESEINSSNSKEKSTKEQKSLMSVVSVTGTPGSKRERNSSQSRTRKTKNLGKLREQEDKGAVNSSYFQYTKQEKGKDAGPQNLLTLQNEIFKYAKVYKV